MGADIHPDHLKNGKPKQENGTFREKVFVERNSLIDDLMLSKHMVTIYHMFWVIVIGFVVQTAVNEYFQEGTINLAQHLLLKNLIGFDRFATIWIILFLCSLLVYYCFKYWATIRTGLPPKSFKIKFWDYCWLGVTVMYYPIWLYIFTKVTVLQEMSFFFTLIMGCEITRMLMKIHAFIRSNVPRALNYKPHTENGVLYPTFSQFMYFLWAPTAVYRDHYPRTKSIRWSYVAFKMAEFIAALLWINLLIERHFATNFKDFGIKPYSWSDFAVKSITNAGIGLMLMLSMFYAKLHVWMGAFAEICRFADRMFYQDWWTSASYERYHRTWNLVVHDWLYAYVYRDLYEIIFPGNKTAAKWAVFFISAVVHEYILAISIGFIFPILFLQFFICGTVITYIKIKPDTIGNILLLYSLGIGCSISTTAFSIEYYARKNCPLENPTIYDFLIPRCLSCGVS